MITLVVLLLAGAVAASERRVSEPPPVGHESVDEQRAAQPLLGGYDSVGERPWMAALLKENDLRIHCGATLIAPDWALTAAHCIANPFTGQAQTADYELLLGTKQLNDENGQRIRVSEVIIHPDYVPPGSEQGREFDNDIALLRLARPAEGFTPVDLPGQGFDALPMPPRSLAVLLGWGVLQYDQDGQQSPKREDFPKRLQELMLPVVGREDCAAAAEMEAHSLTRRMLCAGRPDTTEDSCAGDSGGPLAVPDPGAASGFRQIGIVSWGYGCGQPDTYGVYTRVDMYADWIRQQVCSPDEIPPQPAIIDLRMGADDWAIFDYAAAPDVNYRIFYTPAQALADGLTSLSPIRHLDMGASQRFEGRVTADLAVAVQSYRGACSSPYSNIVLVQSKPSNP